MFFFFFSLSFSFKSSILKTMETDLGRGPVSFCYKIIPLRHKVLLYFVSLSLRLFIHKEEGGVKEIRYVSFVLPLVSRSYFPSFDKPRYGLFEFTEFLI